MTLPKNIPRRTGGSLDNRKHACADSKTQNSSGLEKKSGHLLTTRTDARGRTQNIRVVVKVYASTYDHYAVVYADKICQACGFINLKHCTIDPFSGGKNCGFRVIPKDCEGNTVTFITNSPADLEEWLNAFTYSDSSKPTIEFPLTSSKSPSRSVSPPMPTLEEDEETENERSEE